MYVKGIINGYFSDRIIFDIDTASILPIFPFGLDDINQNPYA